MAVAGQGAVAPQAIAIVANDRRDIGVVEQVGATGLIAVEELHRTAGAGDALDLLVRRRGPEAVLGVGPGEQAGGVGRSRGVARGIGGAVPNLNARVDHEKALAAEVLGVGDGRLVGAIGTIENGDGPQFLGQPVHGGGHRLLGRMTRRN